MRQDRTVDLPQIARHERIFGNQLLFLELAVDQHDVSVPIKLGAAKLQIRARLDIPASQPLWVVQ